MPRLSLTKKRWPSVDGEKKHALYHCKKRAVLLPHIGRMAKKKRSLYPKVISILGPRLRYFNIIDLISNREHGIGID